MRATALMSLVVLAGAAVATPASVSPASAQTTVDRMTCAAAQRSAAATRRYYKRTGFGVVPIMPVFPYYGPNVCQWSERQVPQVERTLGGQSCVIGYKCEERDDFDFYPPFRRFPF